MVKHIAQWAVDLQAGFVEHSSGLRITFTALPGAGLYQGTPLNIPPDMTAKALSQLIRQGFEQAE